MPLTSAMGREPTVAYGWEADIGTAMLPPQAGPFRSLRQGVSDGWDAVVW